MNGIHDMGGMQDFGPVSQEEDEPIFHHEWQRRVFALTLAMGFSGKWNLDATRSFRESVPPRSYLNNDYYEIWFDALMQLLLREGLVTQEELDKGRLMTPALATRVLARGDVASLFSKGWSSGRALSQAAKFTVGERVRTINSHPTTHTRLPRYCRGRPGVIESVHGGHVFPDTNALGKGEHPQWLYSVRFEAKDLWGPDTTASAVNVDCWESYLIGDQS